MDEAANVRAIQTLADLQAALGRFSGETGEALRAAEVEIRRTQEWLRERELYWQREVEKAREEVRRAQAALNWCLSQVYTDRNGRTYRPSCHAERAALMRAEAYLRQVEAELQKVKMWRARVEQAVGEYRLQERRLQELTTAQGERAKAFLERKREELERYRVISLLASVAGVIGGVGAVASAVLGRAGASAISGLRGLPGARVAGAGGDAGALSGLKPETWRELSLEERAQVSQNLENTMAQAQGRPPVELRVEEMEPGPRGGYDRQTRSITLDREHLRSEDAQEVAGTVVHEGRHAYQHYAVEHPGFHPDAEQVEAWRKNFEHYLTPGEYGWRRYRAQPIEDDAWRYAEEVITSLFGGKR